MDAMKRFSDLLKVAIGERTQGKFSEETGIATAQLSRMASGKQTSKPRPETLEKIANASEGRVTLEELMSVFGYDMEGFEEKKANSPDNERARKAILSLLQGYNFFSGTKYDDIRDLTDTVNMIYSEEATEYSFSKTLDCPVTLDNNADSMVLITLGMTLKENKAIGFILVTFNETKGGKIIPSKAFTDSASFRKAKVLKEEVPEGMDTLYVLHPQKGMTQGEIEEIQDALSRIVGNRGEKYISAATGSGFAVSSTPPDTFKSFCENHKASIPDIDQRDIEKYFEGKGDALSHIICNASGNSGWGAVVANVMTSELGFKVSYWAEVDSEFHFRDNPDCIIVEDEEKNKKGLTNGKVLDLVEPYAKELGVREIGPQYFQTVFDKATDGSRRVK